MKYKAIIETDDYKDFEFFEDGNGKYLHAVDAAAENNEWIPLYFTECEQEPCEDAVSRKAAIVQLSHNKIEDDDCDVIIQKDIEAIKALPPVTPKPRTGKWIDCGERDPIYRCSECGERVFGSYYKFCPYCAADMKGESE